MTHFSRSIGAGGKFDEMISFYKSEDWTNWTWKSSIDCKIPKKRSYRSVILRQYTPFFGAHLAGRKSSPPFFAYGFKFNGKKSATTRRRLLCK
jgi:hypothetical protein